MVHCGIWDRCIVGFVNLVYFLLTVVSEEARVLYKRMLRQPTIDRLRNQQEEEIDEYIKLNTQESFQKSLEMIMIFLKKRKQSKL